MDLSSYTLEDLLLAAIKSEIESKRIYEELSKKFKNAFLKDKLKFLSEEEEKHRAFIYYVYRKNFKDKEPILPKKKHSSASADKYQRHCKFNISKIYFIFFLT